MRLDDCNKVVAFTFNVLDHAPNNDRVTQASVCAMLKHTSTLRKLHEKRERFALSPGDTAKRIIARAGINKIVTAWGGSVDHLKRAGTVVIVLTGWSIEVPVVY